MRIAIVIFITWISGASAQAATSASSYPTDFYTVDTQTDPTTIKIYTGSTSTTCTPTGAYHTCNSCAKLTSAVTGALGSKISACNTNQISSSSQKFQVTLTSDSDIFTTSTAVMVQIGSAAISSLSPVAGTIAKNSPVTVELLWSQICSSINPGDTPCQKSFPLTNLTIGFSKDGSNTITEGQKFQIAYRYVDGTAPQTWGCPSSGSTVGVNTIDPYEGFCQFTAFPGDQKVYLNPQINSGSGYVVGNLTSTSGSPLANGADASQMKYAALRIYVAKESLTPSGGPYSDLTRASDYADLKFDPDSGSLITKKVNSLTNGSRYIFMTASVDQGGNVTHFSTQASLQDSSCNNPNVMCYDTVPFGQTQAAIPDTVYGMLDGQSCFIATATFGSSMAPEVETFRKFRNQFLLPHLWGKTLVRQYYKWSPPVAHVIAEHESLRFISRLFLWPILLFVQLALAIGFLPALLSTLFAGAALVVFGLKTRRRSPHGANRAS